MSWLNAFKNWKQRREALTQSQVALLTADVDKRGGDMREPVRWGVRMLWLALLAFLLWGALAPLGQGVPAGGSVVVEGNRKTIQHSRGGVVEQILVREGQIVQAQQPLLRLNAAQAQAQQGSVEGQLLSLMAVEARLQAERASRTVVSFPLFVQARARAPEGREIIAVQEQLFATRRAALQGETNILTETLSGLLRQQEGLQAREASNQRQYKLYSDELAALKPMYEQGFVPRQRMFELERSLAYVDGQRNEDAANLGRVRSQMSEVRLKISQTREVYRREVESQLADVQRQVADLKERSVATQDELQRIVLRAPEAGTVVELSVHTEGGVAAPGQKLMDIVPLNSRLMVEVMIPVHLVDGVHVGQAADIHFPALDQTLVPAVEGRLVYLAADRQTDERTGLPYFTGRVEITTKGLGQLQNQQIRPGMPADAVIRGSERSLFAYLLKPLLSRFQQGMTER